MEYRSPLGYNFKFEKSLSASREEESKETPKTGEQVISGNSGKKGFDSGDRRNSGGNRNSPAWQRQSYSNWKSPNNKSYQQDEPVPIEQYYHPSMLENPWEELEKNN